MQHPNHEAIAAFIRSFVTGPVPDMGWVSEERRFGLYKRNIHAPGYENVTVRHASAANVPEVVADARAWSPHGFEINVDDRDMDRHVEPALSAAGADPGRAIAFLAFVGEAPLVKQPAGLALVDCSSEDVELYVETKQKAFADSDDRPDSAPFERELRARRAEHAGGARLAIAYVDGEPAATMLWYAGEPCDFVHQLGTRVPFRERGFARYLLSWLISSAVTDGRTVVIDANEHRTPIEFYRRLGFTDEVYWRREYRFRA